MGHLGMWILRKGRKKNAEQNTMEGVRRGYVDSKNSKMFNIKGCISNSKNSKMYNKEMHVIFKDYQTSEFHDMADTYGSHSY